MKSMNSLIDPLRRQPLTAIVCIFSLFSLGFIASSYRDSVNTQAQQRKQPSNDMHKQRIHSHMRGNSNDNGVQRIALLGERNSGTNWMTDELTNCYPHVEVSQAKSYQAELVLYMLMLLRFGEEFSAP